MTCDVLVLAKRSWMGAGWTDRTWPDVDTIFDLAVFEPTPAIFLPNGVLVHRIHMFEDVVDSVLLGGNGSEALVLHRLYQLQDVLNGSLDSRQESAVCPCGAWPHNCEVVGEPFVWLAITSSGPVTTHLGAETPK
jgi:hypothetical protein